MEMTPQVGNRVKIVSMKPGYLAGVKGTLVTVRPDERGNVKLSPEASARVRQAIASRGKPWQEKLFPVTEDGTLIVPAVPFANMEVRG